MEMINKIFFPYASARRDELKEKRKNLAYYTTAETAKKIIKNKELWMRNASVMNDFGEIRFGANALEKVLYGTTGDQLVKALCKCTDFDSQKICRETIHSFFEREKISWIYNSYITCFTEHEEENKDGRLSMWRSYGAPNGVAIVFNRDGLFNFFDNKRIFLSPVAYISDDNSELQDKVMEVVNSISEGSEILKEHMKSDKGDKETLTNSLKWALRGAITSIKHKGFREEKEWRLVANGIDLKEDENLGHLVVENVYDIDQLVFKIKFSEKEMFDMIDCILIGPHFDLGVRNVMQKAFVRIVSESFSVTMEEAEKKVSGSGIPYRPM